MKNELKSKLEKMQNDFFTAEYSNSNKAFDASVEIITDIDIIESKIMALYLDTDKKYNVAMENLKNIYAAMENETNELKLQQLTNQSIILRFELKLISMRKENLTSKIAHTKHNKTYFIDGVAQGLDINMNWTPIA